MKPVGIAGTMFIAALVAAACGGAQPYRAMTKAAAKLVDYLRSRLELWGVSA